MVRLSCFWLCFVFCDGLYTSCSLFLTLSWLHLFW
jgi:hypothetical protein